VTREVRQVLYEKRNLCYTFFTRGIGHPRYGGRPRHETKRGQENWI
jgi:hypothetical protein